MPQSSSDADLRGVLRRGGGVSEWLWKGGNQKQASIELVAMNPRGGQPLRHVLSFRGDEQGFQVESERIEDESPAPGQTATPVYYSFQHGAQARIAVGNRMEKLPLGTFNSALSILAQYREPIRAPEITFLSDLYAHIRIYREWTFGTKHNFP